MKIWPFCVTLASIYYVRKNRLVLASMPSVSKLVGATTTSNAFWMGLIRCDCPAVTRGFVEFHVHPLVQGPLYNGASADVEDTQGNVYPVVVRSIGHIRPDLSSNPQWDASDFQLTVDKITLEQAQTMRKLTRTTGPEENTFVATVLDAQGNLQLSHHIDLNVQVLQHGLLHRGEAQGVSKGGESKSIVIHALQATPSVSGSGRLLITVEGISLAQSRELQTLVQDL